MRRFQYRRAAIVGGLCTTALLAPSAAKADNGGLSFWLPGTFGSLAAAPTMPGWAYSTIYLHVDQTTGASATVAATVGKRHDPGFPTRQKPSGKPTLVSLTRR